MAAIEGRDPVEDYKIIRNELTTYNVDLEKRPEIIVANKMDYEGAEENLKRFKEELNVDNVIAISALEKKNVEELLYRIADMLDEVRNNPERYVTIGDEEVEYTYVKPESGFTVYIDDDGVYCVEGPAIKKLFDRMDFNSESNVKLFAKKLRDMGVDKKLRELGAKNGDTVRILGYEFEFYD